MVVTLLSRTLSICRFLVLKRDAWEQLKAMYPHDARRVELEASSRLEAKIAIVRNTFVSEGAGAGVGGNVPNSMKSGKPGNWMRKGDLVT